MPLKAFTHLERYLKGLRDGDIPDDLYPETHLELWLEEIAAALGGGLPGVAKMEVVWENASPTSSMSPQTIEMDLSDYDYIIILYKTSGLSVNHASMTGSVGTTVVCFTLSTSLVCTRSFGISTSGIELGGGVKALWSSISGGLSDSDNNLVIPVKFIGIKVV